MFVQFVQDLVVGLLVEPQNGHLIKQKASPVSDEDGFESLFAAIINKFY